MSLIDRNSLLTRLAVAIIFTALAIGFISAQVFYRITYSDHLNTANAEVKQLFETVAATSSIAAYLEDEELANEVLNGLITNNILQGVRFEAGSDINVSQGQLGKGSEQLTFTIMSPFEDKQVGSMILSKDLGYIQSRAEQVARYNAQALTIQALVVTIISLFVAYILVTKPISQIKSRLNRINPSSPERLPLPDFHKNSELGSLVKDVNGLLSKTESYLNKEKQFRQEIETLEKRFRLLFENSISPIVLIDAEGNLVLSNSAFESLLFKMDMRLQKTFGPYLHQLFEEPDKVKNTLAPQMSTSELALAEFELKAPSSSDAPLWVQIIVTSIQTDDFKEYLQITLHDISSRREELEKLSELADYDQLTGLLNRNAAERTAQDWILEGKEFATLLMDLNGFKPINDLYGHDAGDEILQHVANQMLKGVDGDDLVCRWGGDEFVILKPGLTPQDVTSLLDSLREKISKPYYLAEQELQASVSASFGVAFFPHDAIKITDIIKLADQKMYEDKRQQQNTDIAERG